jgi:hypothetical protein
MKKRIAMTAVALAAWSVTHAQSQTNQPTAATPPEATTPPAASDGLQDLATMTFGCPRAALNAAAREAAKAPSQGTYQFSFFRIINDSHHGLYEVHFKSNYEAEPELKYCVALYCQQGWDPATTRTSVQPMSSARQPRTGVPHAAECSIKSPAKRR